jgi:protein TonB
MSLVIPLRHEHSAARQAGLWAGAAVVVVAAHVGIAASLMAFQPEPESGGAPDTAIMVELAPITTSIDAERADAPADVEQELQPEEIEPEPIEEPEVLEPLEPPPLEPMEQPVIELPEPEVIPEKPEVVLPVAKPKPPEPKPEKAEREESREKRPERKRPVKKPRSEVASQRASADAPRAERSSAAEASSSVSNANALAAWQNRVSAQLRRYVRGGNTKGVIRLVMKVDAQGNIVSSSASSANASLQRAALSVAQRAGRVAVPPPEMINKSFSILITIQ